METHAGTQLPLFDQPGEPLAEVGPPSARAGWTAPTRPERLGKTSLSFIDSRSVLTPAAGFISAYKFTLNPYSGCGFGCEYCYARFFAPTLDEQNSWGQWVKVKENAIDLLRRARKAKSAERRLEPGDTIYMSSVTDPYQPVEQNLGLTRAILEELLEVQPRLTIQTRSPITTRDIDLFKKFKHIRVNFTITTDSEEMRLRYEPHCPAIEVRLKAAEEVAQAGVPIGVSISPMLPITNPEAFGHRLAELNAAEYVTQFFKPAHSRFSAGTGADAVRKMREDGWEKNRYFETRRIMQQLLQPQASLLEGKDGYAPAS
jgi:DNA repair photolyase